MDRQQDAPTPEDLLLEALSYIENVEATLLSWGLVDGGFSHDELDERIAEYLGLVDQKYLWDPAHIRKELIERRLLVELNLGSRRLIRSRMAETVRLLARLRQLFPRHLHGGAWRSAPTLVSDYRLRLRPRTFPVRNISAESLLEQAKKWNIGSEDREILATLIKSMQLSGFQARATEAILANTTVRDSTGVIITAGTGSGKTLAFYAPALTRIAARISSQPWTQAIAVYPRNELLKDQFTETFIQARRLDALQAARGRRKIRIGTFYGGTPAAARWLTQYRMWERKSEGWICPFLRCPACGSDMIWPDHDARDNIERLTCTTPSCDQVIGPDEIVLTRNSAQTTPPDILFTTTEMLNRQITNTYSRHVFGLGRKAVRKPDIVLLDEVHTYHATHGAQVAFLLRRWRHAVGTPVQFVGLSATLMDAERFFSELTGVQSSRVAEVGPYPGEMTSEGMEYLLALRGDPVSATSLVSTTIQTAMLLGRAMEPMNSQAAHSGGAFGQRLFLFTDDLDVTNRLYYKTLDAEGRNYWGKPLTSQQRPEGSLATLRAPFRDDYLERLRAGQSWDLAIDIGHPLRPEESSQLSIGRTSSQDAGVDSTSNIVVATASLEVGFNDPTVGAIIQHKAPRDPAQFIQRMGRAGRPQRMRPWTVVVLSDYGRDRIAYQGYDLLFDPALRAKHLPIANRYVLRMQAVFATLDWLAGRLQGPGTLWKEVAEPDNGRQPEILNQINTLLTDPTARANLKAHLTDALGIADTEADVLLWDPPRPILAGALATLRRRLITNWGVAYPDDDRDRDYFTSDAPLPDFVPRSLFSDLALPEVAITTPHKGGQDVDNALPVVQAIREFTPGRVTRRYATRDGRDSHWIPTPESGSVDLTTLSDEYENIGTFSYHDPADEVPTEVRCIRPWRLRPQIPPGNVLDTSNARPRWRSQIIPQSQGEHYPVPSPSPWEQIMTGLRFFTHSRGATVAVRRFSIGSDANTRYRNGSSTSQTLSFILDGSPAAVGFVLDVDAVAIELHVPPIEAIAIPESLMRSLRGAHFEHLVNIDTDLGIEVSSFQRDWLAQIYLSAIAARSISTGENLQQATTRVTAEELAGVLDTIFQTLAVVDDDDNQPGDDQLRGRLHDTLTDLLKEAEIRDRLRTLASSLYEPRSTSFHEWIHHRIRATVGAAIVDACQRLVPDLDAGDLLLDLGRGVETDSPVPVTSDELWITEATMGGAGAIEAIMQRYSEDPRRFFHLVNAALGPTDFELVDSELTRILELSAPSTPMADRLANLRTATTHAQTMQAFSQFVTTAMHEGVFICHPVVAALSARVLRPGTSGATDHLLKTLLTTWQTLEDHLGIEVDARVIAYTQSQQTALDTALAGQGIQAPTDAEALDTWRFNMTYSLLWPRGRAVRAQALAAYNRFQVHPPTERLLIELLVPRRVAEVDATEPRWRAKLGEALVGSGEAVLVAPAAQNGLLRDCLLDLLSEPIERAFLHLYPRIIAVRRHRSQILVHLELKEGPQ